MVSGFVKRAEEPLGTPEVPFFPFYCSVSLLNLNITKKGTRIILGFLGNLNP